MYWLLLPVAALTLFLGLRTPSPLAMAAWLILTAVLLIVWAWARFRDVFPEQTSAEIALTPMDPEALRHLREQAQAERTGARGPVPTTPAYAPRPPPLPQAPLPPSGTIPREALPSAESAAVPSSSIFSANARSPFEDDPAA